MAILNIDILSIGEKNEAEKKLIQKMHWEIFWCFVLGKEGKVKLG